MMILSQQKLNQPMSDLLDWVACHYRLWISMISRYVLIKLIYLKIQCINYKENVKLQGICGNPWPILNSVVKGLSKYDIPTEKCSNAGLVSDPDNCSGYVSCIKGIFYQIFTYNLNNTFYRSE